MCRAVCRAMFAPGRVQACDQAASAMACLPVALCEESRGCFFTSWARTSLMQALRKAVERRPALVGGIRKRDVPIVWQLAFTDRSLEPRWDAQTDDIDAAGAAVQRNRA